jgi:hypothetical protein
MSGLATLFRGAPDVAPPPTDNSAEVRRREAEARMRSSLARGRSSTILTEPGGLAGEGGLAPLGTKSLLGS